ncbi:uncharacterized protein CTHT_0047290 [Thermochaetoides thermophila DSM 1495]|uniref:Uncharacterized protein n=1 Tax=Chaetomium thermophilum (strain DSM 1495 / CBS 144.50 / IMI 039719) TaxID=759272 RepID=G0S9V2_CHATD|nr:hypothetical protein CTHT_0047290 [Thermochaetoides thermophila DSM 1495]EGS20213.1 hypothetical protein CTHT_0047290 [Thermochaetoides thermophila DSM 1495]
MHPRVAGPLGKVKQHPGFTLYALDDNSTRAVIYIDRRLTASATNAPKPALVSATMNGLTITNTAAATAALQTTPQGQVPGGHTTTPNSPFPPPAAFETRQALEEYAWAVYDVLAGVVGRFAIRPGKHTRSARWWTEVLATAREVEPVIYQEMAAYLVTQVFRPAGAQEGTGLPARLPAPPDWAAKLAAVSNDDELKDAILEATSNVAGAVPSRSALDLVQSLVHDAEPMVRQSYHELLVTVDVDSTYLSVDTTKTEVLHIPPVASGPSAIESTQRGSQLKSDFADTPTKTGLAYIRRQRASGPSPDGNRVAWGLGRGLVSLQTPRKGAGYPSQL